jgi:hypothetical protein
MKDILRKMGLWSLALGMVLPASAALAGGIPGVATKPGDVSITSLSQSASYTLVCGNGGTVDFGAIAAGQSAYVASGALGTCNKQAIWVQSGSVTACKWLTDYRTDYAPINFNVNPATGECSTGAVPIPPDPGPTPKPTGKYILGGWVGDDGWNTPLPSSVGQLDVLNLGYITCVSSLRNGPCKSPGQRNANDGPPAALANAAKVVTYVLGGDGCNSDNWNVDAVVNAGGDRWGGVDIDKECPMDQGKINATVQALTTKGKTSIITFLTDVDKSWLAQVQPAPTYYAAMAFWGSEFCSASNPAPGCVRGPGGLPYETFIPRMIGDTLKSIGSANSRKMILGLHAVGTNEATVDFWCSQVKSNNLGGVFVSFIEKMPPALFSRLNSCLAN